MIKNYWLLKSEGDCYSIDDFKKDTEGGKGIPWSGIRSFQARNFMRDRMNVGDLAFFYHSNGTKTEPTGIYGIAKVVGKAHIDATALDPKDEHYDAKAVKYVKEGKDPMWMCVDMTFVKKFARPISLSEIKLDPILKEMEVAKIGQRLSVMPVSEKQWSRVLELVK